ncbi:MAG: glycoside hydrolase [Acidobacteriota bacterium]|nr:glycoside hydrolase [Acidobacteriota bacterium]
MWRLFVISVLLVCCTTGSGQTHQHGMTPTTGNGQFNPFVISDNRGGFYLAYIERTNNVCNVMLRYSTDGKTFSAPVRVNDLDGDATVRNENPPKLAFAPNGNVYVSWANERGRWKGNIRFARSTDGGKTFSQAIALNSDAGGEPAGHAFQSIAMDAKGKIYIAWIDERNKKPGDRGAEIWLSTSSDGGKSFSRDRRILSDVCECCRTTLQVDASGRVFLSYRTVPPAGPMNRDIIVARSEDGGKTFTPIVVSQDGWELNGCPVVGPTLTIDAAGTLAVVWFVGDGKRPGLYFTASSDHGKGFSARQLLDGNQRLGKHAHTVRLSNGKTLVAWDDSAEKSFSIWGVLDMRKGLLQKGSEREGILYPVAAVNNQVVVVAGMRAATHEVAIFTEHLNGSSGATSVKR